ncbi:MAG: bifunctional pyr operon transcriptional regulator/uracil phosphoribosyltransferase PyrR [Gemmatimonadetes bacterium]|nr:bifunctional pyr operon transcriptional regulator/uracil phosphoribosyltransferase PyrR [Gemmatimonadota bacterium]
MRGLCREETRAGRAPAAEATVRRAGRRRIACACPNLPGPSREGQRGSLYSRPTGAAQAATGCSRRAARHGSSGAETTLTHNVLDEAAARGLLAELSAQLDRAIEPDARLILIGIHRRGDSIAAEIGHHLEPTRGSIPIGSLDITLYRDDFGQVGALPTVGTTRIPESIEGAHIVIVDDVLHTGRTIRAALQELSDFGRARRIQLCVLVDRGGRQLPIQPDYVGRVIEVGPNQDVAVRVADTDGDWGIDIVALPAASEAGT